MLIIEALLLTTLAATLAVTIYTDCKNSIIHNRTILIAITIGFILDGVYYGFFAQRFFLLFIKNLIVVILAAFFFYCYHLWAAGDSKLFFAVGLFVPARFYSFWKIGSVPCFAILILVFSIAFIYVIGESVVLGLRQKNLLKITVGEVNYRIAITAYLSMVAATMIVNWMVWKAFGNALQNNLILALAVNFFVVLTLSQIRNKLSDTILLIVTIVGWVAIAALTATNQVHISTTFDWKAWLFVLGIMFVRMVAEKYNYQEIPTAEVRAGQILSAATVMLFQTSRVRGLPGGMTEDLRSRITSEEAESVHRWEKSVGGKPHVIIVRKIPFAIFIGVGTLAFLIIEVIMQ